MTDLPVFATADLEAVPPFAVESFTNDDAVDLGLVAVEVIRERGLNLAVRVELRGDIVFVTKVGTTGPDNDIWITRKSAVAREHGVPSLLVRRRLQDAGTLDEVSALDSEKAYYGGSVPILVGGEVIGTITASGEPDVLDHDTAAEAVRRYLAR
ncbi:heme-binding protein [Microbacterium sp. X-17]|uniref:heme-binding protein n=1 Tax=Microbacterium sp. X-17 TaxID=3144404 RepID=UPI0031F596B9